METFTWTPSYGSAVTTKPNVTASKFGDGYEARVPSGLNSKPRQWRVSFNRPATVCDAIGAFLDARGAVLAFNWTPPHGATGVWVCREWSDQQTGPYTRSLTATFDEVFEY